METRTKWPTRDLGQGWAMLLKKLCNQSYQEYCSELKLKNIIYATLELLRKRLHYFRVQHMKSNAVMKN